MKKQPQLSPAAVCFYTAAVLISILFAILYALTPHAADDLLFLHGTQGMTLAERASALPGELLHRWHTETGRLGTLLSLPFLYLLPKWVFGILTGLVIFLLMRFSVKLSGVTPGSLLSWLVMGVIVFVLPWYDFLFLESYSLNYVWGGCLAVAAAYYFMSPQRAGDKKIVWMSLLTFLAGWTHEAYGAPLCVATTVWLFLNRNSVSRKALIPWFSLGIGTALTFLSPMLWTRAETEANLITKFPLKEAVMQLGPAFMMLAIAILAILVCLCRRKWRMELRAHKAKAAFFAAFILTALAVFIKFYNGPRTDMPLVLFCGVAAAFFFGLIPHKAPKILTLATGALIGLGSIIHLIYTNIRQKELLMENNRIVQLFRESPSGTFYLDVTYPHADISLFKTSVRNFHARVPIWMFEVYYSDLKKKLAILPEDMKGFSEEKAKPSAYTPQAMIYNGRIILPEDYDLENIVRIKVFTKQGAEMQSRYLFTTFEAEDGNCYILLTPHVKTLDNSIEIVDVDMSDSSR